MDELPPTAVHPVSIDGRQTEAADGETVLALLLAHGHRAICSTDRGQTYGAFCGMGVCYSCCVRVDGISRQRACQVLVSPGMQIETRQHELAESPAE